MSLTNDSGEIFVRGKIEQYQHFLTCGFYGIPRHCMSYNRASGSPSQAVLRKGTFQKSCIKVSLKRVALPFH